MPTVNFKGVVSLLSPEGKKKEFSKQNTTNLEDTEILPQVKYFFVAKEKVLLISEAIFLGFNYSKKPTKSQLLA